MRKSVKIFALLAFAVALTTAFVGCNSPEAHVHEYGEWTVVTEATCGTKGARERVCSCGEKETEEIAATGEHDYEWTTKKQSTCKEEGIEDGVCKKCGNTAERTLPLSTEHKYEYSVKTPATCSMQGEKEGRCSVCGATTTETLPLDPNTHGTNLSEWTVEKNADCRHTGKRFRNCIDCGARIEEAIAVDPDAHELGAPTETVASTCSKQGYEKYVCDVCSDEIVKTLPLDPDAHDFGSGEITAESTCVTSGKKTKKCKYCTATEQEDLPVNEYNHEGTYTTVDDYKVCSACKGLLDKQIDIVNAGKYQKSYDLYLDGEFDVEFTFHNKAGSNAEWHNFIFDIAPMTYIDGKRVQIKNASNPITPVIPWWTENYYGAGEHPFLHVLDGSKTVSTSWFLDDIEDTPFAACMKKGVDVTASFKRQGTDVVDVKVVMTTTNDAGVLRTCTLTATLGYKGVPSLYVALTGESNTVNLKQVKIKSGTLCPETKTEEGSKVLNGETIDNVGVKNANGKNLVFGNGDFDVMLDFDIDTHQTGQPWHNYLVYIFKGKDADTSVLNGNPGKLYMTMAGIGREPDNTAIFHDINEWFVEKTSGVDFNKAIGTAHFKLRLTRKNGYFCLFGNAYDGEKVIAQYRYFSSINSDNEWYNHGDVDGDGIIRLSTENAKMTVGAVTIFGGDVKLA